MHTIIRSNRRYAYEEAQQVLEDNGVVDGTGQPAPNPGKKGFKDEFGWEICTLDRLAKKLREKRFKAGSVNFDTEELHFDIDEKGHPVRCYFKRSKDANKLIEEFMLLANRTVAESIGRVAKGMKAKVLPYRIHDNPDPEKMENLRKFIVNFGLKVKTDGTRNAMIKSINKLIGEVEGKREGKLVQAVALRAMMKAKYSVHNIGHFGLGFDYYTHFTSPIRRYPDTMVHRLLTRYAAGGRSANEKHYEDLCDHCSEIDENQCEGMIPMRDLVDDYYEFDEKNFMLRGRRHHHKYQLGDPIKIEVAKANLERRQLDFVLASDGPRKPAPKAERPIPKGKGRRSGR